MGKKFYHAADKKEEKSWQCKFMKIFSLKKNQDFKRVYSQGEKIFKLGIIFNFCLNNLSFTRIGFSIKSKIGLAHERNKIRRRILAICRKYEFAKNVDLIFSFKKESMLYKFQEFQKILDKFFKDQGLILTF